jgi:hypothetical protein
MSRERAPVMDRVQAKINSMKSAVLRRTPMVKGEDEKVYAERVKGTFMRALSRMADKQTRWKHGTSKYRKPHQGAQECARRVRQDAEGRGTCNYTHGCQYPSFMRFGDTL